MSYRGSVGRRCRRLFAQERAEIVRRGAAAVSGHDPRPQAILVAELLRVCLRDTAAFDEKLRAIVPPAAALRAARQQYLSLETQNSALYALVIPRVEGDGGLPALSTVTGLLSRNAQELQTHLTRLWVAPRALSAPRLGLGDAGEPARRGLGCLQPAELRSQLPDERRTGEEFLQQLQANARS